MDMYSAVVFDFDYTLGDSSNGIEMCINYALSKMGFEEKETETIRKTIGLSLKDTFTILTGKEDENEAQAFSKYFKEKADIVMVDNTIIYPGILESLQSLKMRGYTIGIVTTKYHYRIEQILEKYNAKKLIDLIVGADDVKIEKPNPEGLLWVVDQLGLDKKQVLYVGDSIVDAKAAQNAVVDFVGVLTGTTKKEDFHEYNNIFIGNDVNDVCRRIL